jgi:hypothetical protein
VRQRVLAYVTRRREGRTELLVFDQRDDGAASTQAVLWNGDPAYRQLL